MAFKDRLLELRTERGLNQKDCATALHVDNSKYNKWENGANRPDYETVCRIAEHYGVTTDYLLGHSDAKNPEHVLLINELGLTSESIDALREFGKPSPHFPLGGLLSNGKMVTLDQSVDERTLLDVLNSALKTRTFHDLLNIIRTLTSPIPDRVGFTQWEGNPAEVSAHKSYFDAQLEGVLNRTLTHLVSLLRRSEIQSKYADKAAEMDILADDSWIPVESIAEAIEVMKQNRATEDE